MTNKLKLEGRTVGRLLRAGMNCACAMRLAPRVYAAMELLIRLSLSLYFVHDSFKCIRVSFLAKPTNDRL